jgi:hypothetical protein
MMGLRRNVHRKNYALIRNSLKEKMPQRFQNQSMLQNVTMTNQEYVTKYKLRKEKVHVHPGIEHFLTSNGSNEDSLHSIGNFLRFILRRMKIMHSLNDEDRKQLFMEAKKKPIKPSIIKIGALIEKIEEDFLSKIEEVLQSRD